MASPVTVYAVRLRTDADGPVYYRGNGLQTRRAFEAELFPEREYAENELGSLKGSSPHEETDLQHHQAAFDSTAAVVRFTLTEEGEVDA